MNNIMSVTLLLAVVASLFVVLWFLRGREVKMLRAELEDTELSKQYAWEVNGIYASTLRLKHGYRSVDTKTLIATPLLREVQARSNAKSDAHR